LVVNVSSSNRILTYAFCSIYISYFSLGIPVTGPTLIWTHASLEMCSAPSFSVIAAFYASSLSLWSLRSFMRSRVFSLSDCALSIFSTNTCYSII
jgi:hypothetical protein